MELTRALNDYENFLATSTCTVGLLVNAPHLPSPAALVTAAAAAWRRLRPEYAFLCARLQAVTDAATGAPVMGALGPTYRYQPAAAADAHAASFAGRTLRGVPDGGPAQSLRDRVVALGGAGPDTTRTLARADVEAWVDAAAGGGAHAAIVLVLCHACSDAPGALAVGHRYAQLLGAEVAAAAAAAAPAGTVAATDGDGGVAAPREAQPLIDVQAGLFAAHAGSPPDDAVQLPPALRAYQDALRVDGGGGGGGDAATAPPPLRVLPPIGAQRVPREPPPLPPPTAGSDGSGGAAAAAAAAAAGRIEAHFFDLPAAATAALRAAARAAGGTVQGALTVADLAARAAVTGTPLPARAAAAVPVNCRAYAAPPVPPSACVCGSAAATVGVVLAPAAAAADAVRDVSAAVRAAVPGQPVDWLWRLLHAPATLPACSLMDSSVGVSPIATAYAGGAVGVAETLFFGAATATPADAQGTMVHAHTFDGRLHVACNATVPGVSRAWAAAVAAALRACLLALSEGGGGGTLEALRQVAVAAAAAASAKTIQGGGSDSCA